MKKILTLTLLLSFASINTFAQNNISVIAELNYNSFSHTRLKDFQQQLIVREMARLLKLNTKVVTVPTAREDDGLAMSSRNIRLTPEARAQAPVLHQTLQAAKERLANGEKVEAIESWALSTLQQESQLRPEYFSIVDADTLASLSNASSLPKRVVACTAVWAGDIRLIDNLLLFGEL